ncbi:MAG: SAM-dependent methyltransferase, partial [Eubacterium sp.]
NCEGIEGEVTDGVVMITSPFNLNKSKSFNNGLFHIEDLSSYKCACALGACSGETVIDVCSAPGGKAFTIAGMMKNQGQIYAFDLYEHRLKLIDASAKRLGINIIKTAVNDAAVYNPDIKKADKVLCDVPCSGFGIIRRKPEIRYKELDSVKDLPQIQLSILTASSRYLKDNGTLIYSTCTLNKKENEKVVSAFLGNNDDFALTEEKTFFPTACGGDGFYYAVIKKRK